MSGIVSDNTDKQSGLVKTPVLGPDSGSSDPTVSTNPSAVGARHINTTSGEVFVATDVTAGENIWKGQLGTDVKPPSYFGARGVMGGGQASGGESNVLDYVTIATTGNATDFGDLLVGNAIGGSHVSSGSRGVIGGGDTTNVLQYFAFATTGNTTDFGDLVGNHYYPSAVSNGTRGVWIAGQADNSSAPMDYLTISSLGNASDFGDYVANTNGGGTCMSDVRGVYMGGHNGSAAVDTMAYITTATTGNATDFGDLVDVAVYSVPGGCSNGTRGMIGGGAEPGSPSIKTDRINYITIANTGNSTDFGDLITGRANMGGCFSDGTKGLWCGGKSPALRNQIEYVNIASVGDATDFGDLTVARDTGAGMSGDAS